MVKDKSYIQVPSINYITVDLNLLKSSSTPIATGSAGTSTTSTTTGVAIDNPPEAPTGGTTTRPRFEFGSPIVSTGSFDGSIPSSRTTSEFETF